MPQLKAYHRPANADEALQLLSRPQVSAAVVAGGTYISAHLDETVDEVIDLQAAGLDTISHDGARLTLGAMVRLQTIVEEAKAPALLKKMARMEGPNTFRNKATIGGAIVGANPESELLAALLVYQTMVTVQSSGGRRQIALPDFLSNVSAALDGGIIIDVSLATTGQGASERVARTPADRPIVAAVARQDNEQQIHLALCGVAQTPILVEPDMEQLKAALNPPNDFRGSREYRRQMAVTLSKRVIAVLQNK